MLSATFWNSFLPNSFFICQSATPSPPPLRYRQAWGSDKFDASAPIPAFLTGNMWAQEWQNTFSLVSPYPDVPDQVRRP